ncbi:hypothetical protein SK128_020884 [Halocaridina rubra]|uniref:Microtubule-associated protein Jupiter n=1 Tax=Halocaridina rubra TaxID=373956 RepID=A0AAN8WSG3_HALRR
MVRVHQPPGGQTHLNEDLPPEPLNVRVQQPPGGKTHFDDEVMPQQPNVRVLKPPGGDSSIFFGEEDKVAHANPKASPQQQQPPQESPMNGTQEKPAEKAETNGTITPPQTPKDNANATKENNTSATTNGTIMNGTLTNGTNGTHTSGSSTPSSSRLDTQSRLFGDEPRHEMTSRRVRDHHRSNIFSDDKASIPKPVYRRPWTRRDPVTGVGVVCWDLHAPRFAPIKRKGNTSNHSLCAFSIKSIQNSFSVNNR